MSVVALWEMPARVDGLAARVDALQAWKERCERGEIKNAPMQSQSEHGASVEVLRAQIERYKEELDATMQRLNSIVQFADLTAAKVEELHSWKAPVAGKKISLEIEQASRQSPNDSLSTSGTVELLFDAVTQVKQELRDTGLGIERFMKASGTRAKKFDDSLQNIVANVDELKREMGEQGVNMDRFVKVGARVENVEVSLREIVEKVEELHSWKALVAGNRISLEIDQASRQSPNDSLSTSGKVELLFEELAQVKQELRDTGLGIEHFMKSSGARAERFDISLQNIVANVDELKLVKREMGEGGVNMERFVKASGARVENVEVSLRGIAETAKEGWKLQASGLDTSQSASGKVELMANMSGEALAPSNDSAASGASTSIQPCASRASEIAANGVQLTGSSDARNRRFLGFVSYRPSILRT